MYLPYPYITKYIIPTFFFSCQLFTLYSYFLFDIIIFTLFIKFYQFYFYG